MEVEIKAKENKVQQRGLRTARQVAIKAETTGTFARGRSTLLPTFRLFLFVPPERPDQPQRVPAWFSLILIPQRHINDGGRCKWFVVWGLLKKLPFASWGPAAKNGRWERKKGD